MSWIFSKAMVEDYVSSLSSPAQAAAFSEAICLAGGQFAQLSVMPTLHKFWRNDKMIESSDHSRFGLTSQLLTDDHGTELLMSFLADFPVRTSVPPAQALESKEAAAGCGRTWRASLARYDQNSSGWKTAQCSLFEDSASSLVTWPRWGSMLNGVSYLRKIPALPTKESEFGSWPTPRANDAEKRGNFDLTNPRNGLAAAAKLWPTPTSTLASKGGRITPRKGREGGTLIEAVSARTMWATATARDWRSGKASQATHDRNSRPLSEQVGGQLNPEWVEWLMGWPIGWTELKPLAMDKFREWQQQHGGF